MNTLDFFVCSYGLLHNRKFVPVRLLSPIRFFLRKIANWILPFVIAKSNNNVVKKKWTKKRIIVSFTSFPGRIDSVWMVVECMLRQSLLPDQIILWLSEEQFPDKKIPKKLSNLIGSIFQVRFVPNDYRSHKKYIYSFEEFGNDVVITIDDDIFYPTTLVESLIENYEKNPDSIICCYGKEFYEKENVLVKYNKWNDFFSLNSKNVFFGSGGGTLFIPSELFKDVLNIDLALKLCPYADDVWLNSMARMGNKRIKLISRRLILPILNNDESKLCTRNVGQNLNDIQINNVCSYYNKKIFRESL